MKDRKIKTIPVTPDLSVILYEDPDPKEGSYISIKHNTPTRGMDGEAMIAPGDTPSLVKALTEAALELTQSGNYFTGHADGTKNSIEITNMLLNSTT